MKTFINTFVVVFSFVSFAHGETHSGPKLFTAERGVKSDFYENGKIIAVHDLDNPHYFQCRLGVPFRYQCGKLGDYNKVEIVKERFWPDSPEEEFERVVGKKIYPTIDIYIANKAAVNVYINGEKQWGSHPLDPITYKKDQHVWDNSTHMGGNRYRFIANYGDNDIVITKANAKVSYDEETKTYAVSTTVQTRTIHDGPDLFSVNCGMGASFLGVSRDVVDVKEVKINEPLIYNTKLFAFYNTDHRKAKGPYAEVYKDGDNIFPSIDVFFNPKTHTVYIDGLKNWKMKKPLLFEEDTPENLYRFGVENGDNVILITEADAEVLFDGKTRTYTIKDE